LKVATAVSLLDLLRAPVSGAPSSLSEQLALIRKLWRPLLGETMDRLLMMGGEVFMKRNSRSGCSSIPTQPRPSRSGRGRTPST